MCWSFFMAVLVLSGLMETQEEAPPSTSRDGNHDNQSKAQRNQPGPGSESGSGSSCVSFRSDESKEMLPPNFKDIHSGVERGQQVTQRVQSAASSCGSMKSDRSKGPPPDFRTEPGPSDLQLDQQSSETPSGPSVQQHQTQLDSIFLLLEDDIVTFVKKELKKIQKLLSHREDEEEELEAEDEEQRSSRESVMKITVNFLRRMKQEDLADGLQSSKRISLKVSDFLMSEHMEPQGFKPSSFRAAES
ncbi:uncharacterized protein LOC144988901 isoform X3 [Oryzias latipes]